MKELKYIGLIPIKHIFKNISIDKFNIGDNEIFVFFYIYYKLLFITLLQIHCIYYN